MYPDYLLFRSAIYSSYLKSHKFKSQPRFTVPRRPAVNLTLCPRDPILEYMIQDQARLFLWLARTGSDGCASRPCSPPSRPANSNPSTSAAANRRWKALHASIKQRESTRSFGPRKLAAASAFESPVGSFADQPSGRSQDRAVRLQPAGDRYLRRDRGRPYVYEAKGHVSAAATRRRARRATGTQDSFPPTQQQLVYSMTISNNKCAAGKASCVGGQPGSFNHQVVSQDSEGVHVQAYVKAVWQTILPAKLGRHRTYQMYIPKSKSAGSASTTRSLPADAQSTDTAGISFAEQIPE